MGEDVGEGTEEGVDEGAEGILGEGMVVRMLRISGRV